MDNSYQTQLWESNYGKKYTQTNSWVAEKYDEVFKIWFGITRTEINNKFIGSLNKNSKILEVGCNLANQSVLLNLMGFNNLSAIELNQYALDEAQKRINNRKIELNLKKGNVLNIPYEDKEFDMVFTSGVLMHISPENIKKAISEIHRCSNKYIWGHENYNKELTTAKIDKTWEGNYCEMYLKQFNDLSLVREEKVERILDNKSIRIMSMFLLEKI